MYFREIYIYRETIYINGISRSRALTRYTIQSYFKSLKFFPTAILEPLRSHFAHKVAKSKYFQKFKLNWNWNGCIVDSSW